MEDSFGQAKEGLDADLILLNDNPLAELNALKSLNGVMVKGKWLDMEFIENRLSEIANYASKSN